MDRSTRRRSTERAASKFRHNFVGTKGFTDEQAAQQMLYKGAFAIGNPKGDSFYNPFDFDVKNVANTGVVNWGGETYALWEGGKPHKMRSSDLGTVGEVEEVLGTKLRVPQMAAHYRIWEGETKRISVSSDLASRANRPSFRGLRTARRFTNGTPRVNPRP